ncbi:Trm112 family protein [Aliikangiella maris]|uniref:Trm112 family protein n=2 Tax=Aliikangiella maris TaxID=3162458 RepID=A0ABV2BU95_9GAMM
MDNKLLDILVCPLCNSKLYQPKDKQQLICKFDRLSFPVDDGIPVLLPEKGTSLTREQIEQLN